MTSGAPLPKVAAVPCLLAGNATLTVVSKRTGTRYTYRVRSPKQDKDGNPVDKKSAEVRFVEVLTGPSNEANFTFVGTLFLTGPCPAFVASKKSKIPVDAPSVAAFAWIVQYVVNGQLDAVEWWHEGRCCRCGRKLTTPESLACGLGPECAGKV